MVRNATFSQKHYFGQKTETVTSPISNGNIKKKTISISTFQLLTMGMAYRKVHILCKEHELASTTNIKLPFDSQSK